MFMSNVISQKTAVVNEVKSILGSSYDSSMPARDQLTDEQLKTIKFNIVQGIISGTVDFKKDTSDEKAIARYVSGMVSNHLRKAKELNGNQKYTPESTGRGSRDPQISELNKLLKTYTEGTPEFNQIVEAINARKSELASERAEALKAKKKEKELSSIDMDALPEGLKHLANDLVSEINAQ
jgi:hypothetical protein